ncbi:triple tyrosine motif-containing protein [Pontibacter sp. CAU 1760]
MSAFIFRFKLARLALLLLFFLGIAFAPVLAAPTPAAGFPYVQNFEKRLYQAGNQNWSVTQCPYGVMYFGNSNGLLSYDGSHWQLFPLPNNQIVRAVASDNKGRIYTGAYGEMGYWSHNKAGRFVYTSLKDLIPAGYPLNDEIWKIYTDGNRVLFQSFGSIYIYENGRIDVVKAAGPYLFLLQAGGRYFVEVIGRGLYELKGRKLVQLVPAGEPGTSGILSVLPFREGQFLIGTNRHGLFLYDGQSLKPWQNEANQLLMENQLNNGVRLPQGVFAFGTILKGVVMVDAAGKLVQQINKNSGLQNNTVLSLFSGADNNLWLGLDNGIDHIDVNSPLYFYFDKTGKFGTVYASKIHRGKIYLGTNQGLFYSDWSGNSPALFQNLDFKMIPGSQGQVWDLSLQDGELLCGHNDGTFRVEGDRLVKISHIKGGWVIQKLQANTDYLLQGTYNGLALFRKDAQGHWELWRQVEGFGAPSRHVEQDNSGHIWVSHAYKGLFRLTLGKELWKVKESTTFNEAQGLPNDYKVNISRLFNRILFSSDNGFYMFDEVSNKFEPYRELNRKLGSLATSNRVIKANDSTYWFINHGKVALVGFGGAGKLRINTNQFSILDNRMVQQYENISQIRTSDYLISTDNGFVVYSNSTPPPSLQLPQVLIRKLENTTDGTRLLRDSGDSSHTQLELPYASNNIRIAYALPLYQQANVKFQYFLEGYSKQWSGWSAAAQKEFTNLPHGDYVFRVKARVNDQLQTEAASVAFRVLPPWYATTWAYLGYGVLALLLALLLRRLYFRKLQRDQARMQYRMEQEKQEQLRQEALLHEQKLVKLRNEQLKSELSGKSRELANTALNIVYKNELLQNLKVELNKLEDSEGKKIPSAKLRKIQKIIEEGMGEKQDWMLFEKSFDEAHENYFRKLKEGYPELTPNDLKLSAYLRMNMSSKEIASLLNITVRGVELRRYRLRKKLNMEHDKNLVEFFMEL